jgi:hypothetical protein
MNNTGYYWRKNGEKQEAEFEELKGKIIRQIEIIGDYAGLRFICDDGIGYQLVHYRNCCEYARFVDICGELEWLLNTPVLMAEQVDGEHGYQEWEHYTWTFYKLATKRGYVTLSFLGNSNGYYNEEATFEKEILS